MTRILCVLALSLISHYSLAFREDDSCSAVRFAVVDWSDLVVTTTLAQELLKKIGYEAETVSIDSIGDVYKNMAAAESDVLLGNWMPANSKEIQPYIDSGSLDVVSTNFEGAVYTIAVPEYVYNQGITHVSHLKDHVDKFDHRVYGVEKGNSGNRMILDMIQKNDFGLRDFNLVESSERLMLAQVKGKAKKEQWVVFLGWSPHPMNRHHDIRYLDGADDYFGPNKGAQSVRTVVRGGYQDQCPNVARLLENLKFTAEIEESIMDEVLNGFVPVRRAVRIWMHQNESTLASWLKGVKTRDGSEPDPSAIATELQVGWGRLKD